MMLTEEQASLNSGELKSFIYFNHLSDNFSNHHFKALVTIKTTKNKITNIEMEVRITFEDYGEITLFKTDLDPYLFPTILKARFQNIKHIDDEYLKISDVHTSNPSIGKYEIKITPLP